MSEESDDAEDSNAPFDDVTHWVGNYLVRILIALSVLLNVVLGGRLNQTFSARNWEWKRNQKINVVRLLDALLGDGHCSRAWSYWKVRRKW